MLELQLSESETLSENLLHLLKMAAELFRPAKHYPTKEFMEAEYVLPDFGEYDFRNAPYFLGVALALDDPDVDEVDLMKAAQIGWTFFILGYIFKRVVEARYRPCPIMMLFAKAGDGKALHDEKLVMAGEATRAVAECIDFSTSPKSGNRWDLKKFDGGFLKLVGSNSPGNVKSTSKVGLAIVEEPDDTADNVADQGDAIGLLEERLKRYVGSKLIVGGTPAVKGLSKTEKRLEQTDQRVLPVVCHECGLSHVLKFDNVVWDTASGTEDHPVFGRADPSSAVYICPECGTEWDDWQRQENIRNTCYQAYEAGDKLCGWTPTAKTGNRVGFIGLNELYVCIPGTSLGKVVEDYLAAVHAQKQGDDTLMRKFINQKLGEAYEYKDDNVTADELREKAEDYQELLIPLAGLILIAGIDIQRDRIAIIIRAYGRGNESWLIYWGEIWAHRDINDINDPCWTELDRMLFGGYQHESGAILNITAASLDTSDGVTQGATYHYVRTRENKGVNLMAIKGAQSADALPVAVPRSNDLSVNRSKADKLGLKLWRVGTQLIKDGLASRLKLQGNGPNRMHIYQGVRADYFEQMTGEVKAPGKQRNQLIWQPKAGKAIEAWDCEVYCDHAARVEKLQMKKATWWDHKEHTVLQVDLLAAEAQDVIAMVDHYPGQDEPEPENRRASSETQAGPDAVDRQAAAQTADAESTEHKPADSQPRRPRTLKPRTSTRNEQPEPEFTENNPSGKARTLAELGRMMRGKD